jgi:hypothetical protein
MGTPYKSAGTKKGQIKGRKILTTYIFSVPQHRNKGNFDAANDRAGAPKS